MDTLSSKLDNGRQLITKVGALMLQRNLTDLAGGNISFRIEDRILMSPTLAGTRKFWQLRPEEILILDLEGNLLEGEGKKSRETPTHLLLLNKYFPQGRAVIHAHSRNIMVFCATKQSIPPVLEGTLKFGEIKFIRYAHGGSQSNELAENVAAGLIGKQGLMAEHAAAVLAPWHGIFAIGNDLHATLDAIERIEVNAYCILMGKQLLADDDRLDHSRNELKKMAEKYGSDDE